MSIHVDAPDDPMRTSICQLADTIKTVDCLTTLNEVLVRRAGSVDALMFPPDWFRKPVLGNGALLIQAGVEPAVSVPMGKEILPALPAAYVLLNYALCSIVA